MSELASAQAEEAAGLAAAEAALLAVLGVALPTGDVATDLALVAKLAVGRDPEKLELEGEDWIWRSFAYGDGGHRKHPRFAAAVAVPVLLNLAFQVPHWWRTEDSCFR